MTGTHVLLIAILASWITLHYVTAQVHLHFTIRPQTFIDTFSHLSRPWAFGLSKNSNNSRENVKHPVLVKKKGVEDPGIFEDVMHGDIVELGEYYVSMKIGSQEVNLQLDTGSSTLAVPLVACSSCIKSGRRLDLRKVPSAKMIKCASNQCQANTCHAFSVCKVCSRKTKACCSTQSPSMCGFYLRYADGSGASGALVESDVTLGQLTTRIRYGGILKATKGFENDIVDGILGMAYGSLACNPTCVVPFFDKIVKDGLVEHNLFSICTGRGGGTLTLGGVNPALYEGELQWAPMSPKASRNFYDVTITKVQTNGKELALPNFSNAIVDSGTTVLVVSPSTFSSLKEHFLTNYCDVPGLCVASSASASVGEQSSWFSPGYCALLLEEDIRKLPKITIHLKGGVALDLEPEVYMLRYHPPSRHSFEVKTYRCLGISYLDGLDKMKNNVILGNTVLQKYFTVFDREHERIGFAKARSCINYVKGTAGPLGRDAGGSIGRKGWFPTHLVWTIVTFGALIAWVVVLSLFGKSVARRSGYESIPTESRQTY